MRSRRAAGPPLKSQPAGGLVLLLLVGWSSVQEPGARWVFFFAPLFGALVGFVIMKTLIWDLMDEVHDGGDFPDRAGRQGETA